MFTDSDTAVPTFRKIIKLPFSVGRQSTAIKMAKILCILPSYSSVGPQHSSTVLESSFKTSALKTEAGYLSEKLVSKYKLTQRCKLEDEHRHVRRWLTSGLLRPVVW
jgi:hypothetical protein